MRDPYVGGLPCVLYISCDHLKLNYKKSLPALRRKLQVGLPDVVLIGRHLMRPVPPIGRREGVAVRADLAAGASQLRRLLTAIGIVRARPDVFARRGRVDDEALLLRRKDEIRRVARFGRLAANRRRQRRSLPPAASRRPSIGGGARARIGAGSMVQAGAASPTEHSRRRPPTAHVPDPCCLAHR